MLKRERGSLREQCAIQNGHAQARVSTLRLPAAETPAVRITRRRGGSPQGCQVFCFAGHASPVTSLCYSPSGRYLASCSDIGERSIRVWYAGMPLYRRDPVPLGFRLRWSRSGLVKRLIASTEASAMPSFLQRQEARERRETSDESGGEKASPRAPRDTRARPARREGRERCRRKRQQRGTRSPLVSRGRGTNRCFPACHCRPREGSIRPPMTPEVRASGGITRRLTVRGKPPWCPPSRAHLVPTSVRSHGGLPPPRMMLAPALDAGTKLSWNAILSKAGVGEAPHDPPQRAGSVREQPVPEPGEGSCHRGTFFELCPCVGNGEGQDGQCPSAVH